MKKNYLKREEMKKIINGKSGANRIPMLYHLWVYPQVFGENQSYIEELLNTYPNDALIMPFPMPDIFKAPNDDPNFRWVNKDQSINKKNVGMDASTAIEDWDELDDILKNFPNPNYKKLIPISPPEDGRYRVAHWWFCFFERFWSLRGMENALIDLYEYPDEVHRLFDALTDFYCKVIERCKKELNADAIYTTDDIGTQTGPFFSPEIFKEFLKPYYKRLIDKAHSLDMHFWLHTCGNIDAYIPDFIEIGLDVIHPIQKHAMDEKDVAQKYQDKICIWAGFDVQQTIPYGTIDDVRNEVRYLIDTYSRKEGRFMLTMGNGTTADMPLDSLAALLEESYDYGLEKCKEIDAK